MSRERFLIRFWDIFTGSVRSRHDILLRAKTGFENLHSLPKSRILDGSFAQSLSYGISELRFTNVIFSIAEI